MVDMASFSGILSQGEDGIWYPSGGGRQEVSYPALGHADCFSVEDRSFWFKHRNECITSVVSLFPPGEGEALFDIGGGNGVVSRRLLDAGYEAVLVEPGIEGARNARHRGLEHVVCATTETAGFRPGSLPAVGLFDVVEHIADDVGFLGSVRNLMRPRGRVYITVPAFQALWSDEDVAAGHKRRYSLSQIGGAVREAGFTVEFATYMFGFLPLPILCMRALPHRLGISRNNDTALQRDHAVGSPLASRVLSSLCRRELRRLTRARPIGFGGSCLLVACKA